MDICSRTFVVHVHACTNQKHPLVLASVTNLLVLIGNTLTAHEQFGEQTLLSGRSHGRPITTYMPILYRRKGDALAFIRPI